ARLYPREPDARKLRPGLRAPSSLRHDFSNCVKIVPEVRVFVPTFRRAALLSRALHSLQKQTFADWVCEVHNDDPRDVAIGELTAKLSDRRIELHQHEKNLGASASFNIFYQPPEEPYFSILEDDNWWEPSFLQTMIGELKAYPQVI